MTFDPLTVPLDYNVGTDTLVIESLAIPSYEPNPSTCQVGTFTYKLVYLNNPTGAFPNFINQFPVTSIDVATQSTGYLGINNFQVIATDPLTGLFNDEVSFQVNLYCQTTGMTVDVDFFKDLIPYTPALEGFKTKVLPTFGMVPARCIEPYTTTLVPNFWTFDGLVPDWVTLGNDERSFTIYT